MSSRGGGPRSAGTDGSDHAYRQTVDNKYVKAAAMRKRLLKLLGMLFVYYPCMAAFAIGPTLAAGSMPDVHNAPFAAGAGVGLLLALLTYAQVTAKKLNGKLFFSVTKLMVLLGVANLAGGIAMKLVAHEDDRMAWRATEFAVKLVGSGVVSGQLYPIAFSLELLLEIIGFVVPLGVVSVSYKLITTLNLAASAKKE